MINEYCIKDYSGEAITKVKYFTCPNCGKKYIIELEDREVEDLKLIYKALIDAEKYLFGNTKDINLLIGNNKMMQLFKNTIKYKEKHLKNNNE